MTKGTDNFNVIWRTLKRKNRVALVAAVVYSGDEL
jgi:hypothetical protein